MHRTYAESVTVIVLKPGGQKYLIKLVRMTAKWLTSSLTFHVFLSRVKETEGSKSHNNKVMQLSSEVDSCGM